MYPRATRWQPAVDLDLRGWLLLAAGEVLMLSTWPGASQVFVGDLSLGAVTLGVGGALCLVGPAFFGRGWGSAVLGIGAAFFGLVGFALVINALVALAP